MAIGAGSSISQLRAIVIASGDEERHTEWSRLDNEDV